MPKESIRRIREAGGARFPIAGSGSPADSAFVMQCTPLHLANIVDDEADWRVLRESPAMVSSDSRIIATRWHALSEGSREYDAETSVDRHIIKIVLRNMDIRLLVGKRTVHDGVITPGMFHVTEPTRPVRCLFRGPYDVLHLHVPDNLIAEWSRGIPGDQHAAHCFESVPRKDPIVEWLGRAVLEANQIGGSFGHLYADCMSIAVVARLLASARGVTTSKRPKVGGLARWRLKRAIDYVEAQLDKPMRLADVASAAGLTPMHFAAQFRAATGLRAHEYLLRRRIERAQEMLVRTSMPLIDVALSVGFQTQSHFTSVFKRFTGQPPRAWRESRGIPEVGAG